MALKNTAPIGGTPLRVRLNLLTRTGVTVLKSLPFGGAVGIVAAGAVLWAAPRLVPPGWSAEAVLTMGLGLGMVSHRLLDAIVGWFFEPVVRHVRARWEASIRLAKLGRYRKRGMIGEGEARELTERIARADITPRRPK